MPKSTGCPSRKLGAGVLVLGTSRVSQYMGVALARERPEQAGVGMFRLQDTRPIVRS